MSECRFSEKLNELRTAAGLTQAELANVLSVSDKVISKWENGLSTPDIETFMQIAKYFAVTTDALLGIEKDNTRSITEQIRDEMREMNRTQAILSAFDISKSLVPAMCDAMDKKCPSKESSDTEGDNEEVIQPYPSCFPPHRNCISSEDFYNLTVWSDDINLSIMLLRNKNNFGWLTDHQTKQAIATFLAFLADEDTLSVCHYIHNEQCSFDFTVQYIAAHTGISEEKTKEILDRAVGFGLCSKEKAHLVSGEIDIYNSTGEGNILTLITLAYEHLYQCGQKGYDYYRGNSCKMIKSDVNGGGKHESV